MTNLLFRRYLDSHPAAITKTHLTYLEAGAQCIITSSYQASIPGFLEVGYDKTKGEELLLKTVELVEKALEAYLATTKIDFIPLIAASIGPYGAYLANGSEYRRDYGVSDEVLKEFHEERLYLLDETNADFFACETIPSFQEAKILARILKKMDKPAWVSFSCKDGSHINDGTKMEDVVSLFQDHPSVFAIGVNCTEPKYIASLIKIIKSKAPTKRVIVYPNAGMVYDAVSKTWLGTSSPDSFVDKTKRERNTIYLILYDAKLDIAYMLNLQKYFNENRILLKNINKFIRVYIPKDNKFTVEAVQRIRK